MLPWDVIEQIKADMPPLTFGAGTECTDFVASESVQQYLNYYGINFSVEMSDVTHGLGYFDAAGYRICAHYWVSERSHQKGTVWFQHGYTDHTGLCQHAVRWLLQEGYAVFCFDLPGHGLSSGEQATIDSFERYRECLQASLSLAGDAMPRPLHAIGQSTGGAILLNFLITENGKNAFEKVVLLAPLVRAKNWSYMHTYFKVIKRVVDRLPRGFNANSHDYDFLYFLEFLDPLQVKHLPFLWVEAMGEWVKVVEGLTTQPHKLTIIQGTEDNTVDGPWNVKILESKFPHARTHFIEGARHQLVNESEDYRNQLWQLVKGALGDYGDDKK